MRSQDKGTIRVWQRCWGVTCIGIRPSQENWKLAQLLGRTSHSSTRHRVKKAITKVRSRSCSTQSLFEILGFRIYGLGFSHLPHNNLLPIMLDGIMH